MDRSLPNPGADTFRRDRCAGWLVAGLGALAVAVLGGCARPAGNVGETRRPIVGGEPVAPGAWPNVVWLENGCSGVLIHSQVVVYAKHCGTNAERVWLGENLRIDMDAPTPTETGMRAADGTIATRSVAVAYCSPVVVGKKQRSPDVAFCVLEDRLREIPVVPPAIGCERAAVEPGMKAALVGFGASDVDKSGVGRKRWVTTQVEAMEPDGITIGLNGEGTCTGDSGGPAFVRVPSDNAAGGEWRVLGVLSEGFVGHCGVGFYVGLAEHVPTLEEQTQRELTPCFDDGGTWQKSAGCRVPPYDGEGRPLDTGARFGATCGAPFGKKDRSLSGSPLPSVEIASASWGTAKSGPVLAVRAKATAAPDVGMARVRFDGRAGNGDLHARRVDEIPPFDVRFENDAQSIETVRVTAIDFLGKSATAEEAVDAPAGRCAMGRARGSALTWLWGFLLVGWAWRRRARYGVRHGAAPEEASRAGRGVG